MDLTLERPGDHLFIRSVSKAGIRVVDDTYDRSIILSTQEVIGDWAVTSMDDFDERDVEKILQLNPEIVLVGTGPRQRFLDPRLMVKFYERGAGVEVMTTEAACRTFNVLASELRNVVAALLI
jgi:uncharacterized protein